MNSTPEQPTSVYRYYDINGLLLYVGITSRGLSRNREHNTTKEWWHYVIRQDVDHYPTRAEALSVENSLIGLYRPPFNTQHNPSQKEDREAYLAFVATGGGHAPHFSFRELFKKQGRKITLRRTSVYSNCGVFMSGPESADIAKMVDATPRKVPVSNAGRKGRVRSISVESGRVVALIYGDHATTARIATAHMGYVTQKPIVLRVDSVVIDLESRAIGGA